MYNSGGNYIPSASGGGGTAFSGNVTNYSALPSAASASGEFYFVENSQGTAWLPGSAGGDYWPAGTYYSTGVSWITDISPWQATLAGVNAGSITDQFVSPYTFENADKWTTKEDVANKDASGGYVGLTGFAINLINGAGTVLSNLVSAATSSRNWTFPDKDGTVAMVQDTTTLSYAEKTSAYTVVLTDYMINCTANTFTITLPTAVGIQGKLFAIKNSGAGSITVAADGAETIDGSATVVVSPPNTLQIQSTNANWIII